MCIRNLMTNALLYSLFIFLSPFQASAQETDPYARAAKLVPKSDRAYKDAEFLRKNNRMRGCPEGYFSGRRLRQRYEFAVNIDRMLRGIKTALMELSAAFPTPEYEDGGGQAGVTPKEMAALKRLYTEFRDELSTMELSEGYEVFLARLEEIVTRTNKISLKRLPDFYHGGAYRVDPYIRVAIQLQQMGQQKACETLLMLAQPYDGRLRDAQLMILCRMLFTARPNAEFRPPQIGRPEFFGETDATDWPLSPIEIVDGVPFKIVRGYLRAGGFAESGGGYARYCIRHCNWNKTAYRVKSAEDKKQALQKLLSSPKWKHPREEIETTLLALQIEDTKE